MIERCTSAAGNGAVVGSTFMPGASALPAPGACAGMGAAALPPSATPDDDAELLDPLLQPAATPASARPITINAVA